MYLVFKLVFMTLVHFSKSPDLNILLETPKMLIIHMYVCMYGVCMYVVCPKSKCTHFPMDKLLM